MLDVKTLRELFRSIKQWRALFESEGVDILTGPNGEEYCLQDLEYLYSQLSRLPKRQHQAIELYLVNNMRETDAAVAMGVAITNPVGMYATVGLGKLIAMIEDGELGRFKEEGAHG